MKPKLLTSFDEHVDKYYGKPGTKRREAYEKGFQKFYKEAMLELEKEEKVKVKKRTLSNSHSNRRSPHV